MSRRGPRRTIRFRLTLIYGGLFLASGATLLALTYAFVDHATAGQFISRGPNGSTFGGYSGRPTGSHSGPSGLRSDTGHAVSSTTLTPGQARSLATGMQEQHAHEMHQLLLYSGVALAIMAVLSLALGWLVAGRVLRPLRTVITAARDISATSLHKRLAMRGADDELKELGDTFDQLLARLEASFQAQRRFVANASHELRTPMAWQRTLSQVALADPDADAASLRAAHEQVLRAGKEQERLLEALLTLSRGQAGLAEHRPVDLRDLVARVTENTKAHDVELRTTLSQAHTTGDPRLAERLVANLVDNALRYNVPGGNVEVTVSPDAVLTVRNTGPQVPQAAIGRLLQPFQRLGAERTGTQDGLGIGLSIVQAIAQAHDAALRITARKGGGLDVSVRFPRAPGHNGQPDQPGRTSPDWYAKTTS